MISRLLAALSCAAVALTGTVLAPATAAVPPPTGHTDASAFRGLGTWVDAYDWSRELGGSTPKVTPRTMMFLKKQGVTTMWLQASKYSPPKATGSLLSRDRLGPLLKAAHAQGIRVVAWYLPTFESPATDWRNVDAMLQYKYDGHHFDAVGLDIEDRRVPVATRNARLVDLSKKTRARTWLPLAAIVLPPVLTEVVNPHYWGGSFPWKALGPSYDVWVPMGYYTAYSRYPRWRDAATSTAEDIRRVRAHLGSRVPVHYAGGLAGSSTTSDYRGFTRAAAEQGALGASAYDWVTTPDWAWPLLRAGAPGR